MELSKAQIQYNKNALDILKEANKQKGYWIGADFSDCIDTSKYNWKNYWKNADFSDINKVSVSKITEYLEQWDLIREENLPKTKKDYTSISVTIPELVKGKIDSLVLVNSVNQWKGKFYHQESDVSWENTLGEIAFGTFLGLEMNRGKIIAKVRYFSDPGLDGYPIIKINGIIRRNRTVDLITDMIIERIFVEKKDGSEITWWRKE